MPGSATNPRRMRGTDQPKARFRKYRLARGRGLCRLHRRARRDSGQHYRGTCPRVGRSGRSEGGSPCAAERRPPGTARSRLERRRGDRCRGRTPSATADRAPRTDKNARVGGLGAGAAVRPSVLEPVLTCGGRRDRPQPGIDGLSLRRCRRRPTPATLHRRATSRLPCRTAGTTRAVCGDLPARRRSTPCGRARPCVRWTTSFRTLRICCRCDWRLDRCGSRARPARRRHGRKAAARSRWHASRTR